MTHGAWLDLGTLSDFPEDRPVLRKANGQRFACVRRGDSVSAIDDRCPHQGYPLSQGTCADGVLTCEWHNWKFDLTSGQCLFGGEAVRHYPTRIEGGRVHLNPAIDVDKESARLRAGLSEALVRDEMGRALREALRLGQFVPHPKNERLGPLATAFEHVAADGARRAEYGFDHGLAVFTDLTTWAERGWLSHEETFVAAAHGTAEPSRYLTARKQAPSLPDAADPLAIMAISDALVAERREEAEARVRAITVALGANAAANALLPFLSRHLYDYGHSAIYTAKALELSRRFPTIAADIFAALAVSLAWATAETALPPFSATRDALEHLGSFDGGGGTVDFDPAERATFEATVLSGEGAAANATVEHLRRGVAPRTLLTAVAHAAAERISRFDAAWERRVDAEVSILDVTHTMTFAEAALALTEGAAPQQAARFAVLAAAFVGKVRHGDRDNIADPKPFTNAPDLKAALDARDPGAALALALEMSPTERRAAYAEIAPFAAFDASVRPIFYAHTVKCTEAAYRLDLADPFTDATYLRAVLSHIVPRRLEWGPRRLAAVATKFLKDGRPPEGLY